MEVEVEETHVVQAAEHRAPTTPGWQLMLEVAQRVASGTEEVLDRVTLQANLLARKGEFIPEEHRVGLAQAVAAAATKVSIIRWSPDFVEFLDKQVGREGVGKLLEGTTFAIEECGECEVGYHVVETSPDPDMVKNILVGVIVGAFREQPSLSEEGHTRFDD